MADISIQDIVVVALIFWIGYERFVEKILDPGLGSIYRKLGFGRPVGYSETIEHLLNVQSDLIGLTTEQFINQFVDQSRKHLSDIQKAWKDGSAKLLQEYNTLNKQQTLTKPEKKRLGLLEKIAREREELLENNPDLKEALNAALGALITDSRKISPNIEDKFSKEIEKRESLQLPKWLVKEYDKVLDATGKLSIDIERIYTVIGGSLKALGDNGNYKRLTDLMKEIIPKLDRANVEDAKIMRAILQETYWSPLPFYNTWKAFWTYALAACFGVFFWAADFRLLEAVGVELGKKFVGGITFEIFDLIVTVLIFAAGPDVIHQVIGLVEQNKNKHKLVSQSQLVEKKPL